ncbi:MAG: deoxyguanosinetriphosphate triphosphohydrolase [Lachnospiraceae bacterium]|nr:deoxyguanosinetriphosphate triphosphohydrolase [Lachnospiraceae bacterium]MBQ9563640.1 deoxyguanosinetriphosphate triphosphohydrolase [Lachnospiraceae bacterium]MBR0153108.1 deoxyguanosinetriphosphate triphosphohydrolase [Lachnospiraceae bacterium]
MSGTIREELEQREHQILSPWASFSDESRGRERQEEPCDIRPCYQRDRDRIVHCKAFRRLKDKTQVFLAPEGDHYRTRLTHTLEVSQIARTVSKCLHLNEDLTEAIALGHDLGHTPFGHAGERVLNRVCSGGFHHCEQSVRVVERLEKGGRGLNLTWEVRDGILNHKTSGQPATMEGKVVRLADKIAYVNHDIDDAIRGHILTEAEIPEEYAAVLGHSVKERLNTLIHDMVENSTPEDIRMSEEVERAMFGLRHFMFDHVYTNPVAKGEEYKAEAMVMFLFDYYSARPELMSEEYLRMIDEGEKPERVICDYIAGMTDRFATAKFKEYTIPEFWGVY